MLTEFAHTNSVTQHLINIQDIQLVSKFGSLLTMTWKTTVCDYGKPQYIRLDVAICQEIGSSSHPFIIGL